MKYILMMTAAFFSFNSLAAKHKIFKQYAYIIKRPDSVALYHIEANPVEIKLQDTTKEYVADYLVKNIIAQTKESVAALKKAVLRSNNYESENIKRCPFEGRIAVVFTKGKKSITLIISSSTCRKILIYLPGKVATAQPFDLADNNEIEKVLPK